MYGAKDSLSIFIHYDTDCFLPIHRAAQQGYLETINILLENGAEISARTKLLRGLLYIMLAFMVI